VLQGAAINQATKMGSTALFGAAQHGYTATAEMLVSKVLSSFFFLSSEFCAAGAGCIVFYLFRSISCLVVRVRQSTREAMMVVMMLL
jgi:ankyrin repeat protein